MDEKEKQYYAELYASGVKALDYKDNNPVFSYKQLIEAFKVGIELANMKQKH